MSIEARAGWGSGGLLDLTAPADRVAGAPIGSADRLRSKHLLSIADLSREELLLILDSAEAMKEVGTRRIKKVPALRGVTVVNLFLEPSTRTRMSFEIAEKRLSADTVSIAGGASSLLKGETLVDTARNLQAMDPRDDRCPPRRIGCVPTACRDVRRAGRQRG